MNNLLEYEKELWDAGYTYVAGIDEAGRGPLAGPVVAAAVVFPSQQFLIEGIDDSKKISPQKRLFLKKIIENSALSIGIGIIDHQHIDDINILQATLLAMRMAVKSLKLSPDIALVDGNKEPQLNIPCKCIIKGDSKSMSIAAASIIAKVTRDQKMYDYHAMYPEYGFDQHKGYPTLRHIEAIRKFGYCTIHRKSFKVKQFDY